MPDAGAGARLLDLTDPTLVFGAIAALIFLGFLGNVIFTRFRLNDTLILIAVGVVLGPVTKTVDPAAVSVLTPIVGSLALILILFDGGLAMKFKDLLSGVAGASVLGLIGFTLTTAAIGWLTAFFYDLPLLVGFILGAILGGTSALVVMPSLDNMETTPRTRSILNLESALTDVLVVVVASTLIAVAALGTGPDAGGIAGGLVNTFIVAIVVGAATGLLWLAVSRPVNAKAFGYMVTLGVMFVLYIVVNDILVDGGGPLAVLAFGLVIGNGESLGAWFKDRVDESFSKGMKKFQGEIAFIVRTFFFVYLGVLVDPKLLADPATITYGIILFAALLGARYVAVAAATRSFSLDQEGKVIWVMMPRGLAAAVLAAVPASVGIPGTEAFVALSFLLLVLTNLTTTVGTLLLEGSNGGGNGAAVAKPGATSSGTASKTATRPGATTVRRTTSGGRVVREETVTTVTRRKR